MKRIISPEWTKLVQLGLSGSIYLMGDVFYDDETKLYSAVVRIGFLDTEDKDMKNFVIKEHKVPELHRAKEIVKDMREINLIDA